MGRACERRMNKYEKIKYDKTEKNLTWDHMGRKSGE